MAQEGLLEHNAGVIFHIRRRRYTARQLRDVERIFHGVKLTPAAQLADYRYCINRLRFLEQPLHCLNNFLMYRTVETRRVEQFNDFRDGLLVYEHCTEDGLHD